MLILPDNHVGIHFNVILLHRYFIENWLAADLPFAKEISLDAIAAVFMQPISAGVRCMRTCTGSCMQHVVEATSPLIYAIVQRSSRVSFC